MTVTTTPVKTPLNQRSEYRNPPGTGPWSVYNDVHGTDTQWSDVVNRQSNPMWRDKLLKGQDASNYYYHSHTDWRIRKLKGWYIWPGNPNAEAVGYYERFGVHPTRVNSDATLQDIALKRVKRRIANLEESYQALIPLAELHELRGLVGSLTTITTDLVKALIEIKRTRGRSAWKFAQKAWLTYSFGVSPMMADIKGLGESLWAYLTKGDVRDRVQGSATKDWLSYVSDNAIAGMPGAPILATGEAHHVLSYRFIAGWKFLIRSSNDYTAASHFGFKPPALVPALWELTAYSWIVDYFTTVGDWLEDVFVGQAGTAMYVVMCRRYVYRSVLTTRYQPSAGQIWRENRPGQTIVDYFEFERTPQTSLPTRSLRFKTLDEIGLNGVTKLLNLTALLGRGK